MEGELRSDLLGALEREIGRARNRGRTYVSIEVGDFLEAMRYDARGGLDEMQVVLGQVCCNSRCRSLIETNDHRQVVTFVL